MKGARGGWGVGVLDEAKVDGGEGKTPSQLHALSPSQPHLWRLQGSSQAPAVCAAASEVGWLMKQIRFKKSLLRKSSQILPRGDFNIIDR